MFPEKPGVMKRRELTLEDVAFSFKRPISSPQTTEGAISTTTTSIGSRPRTPHRGLHLQYFHAEWDYRSVGALLADHAKEWSTPAPPTGRTRSAPAPSSSPTYVASNSSTYQNPDYWDRKIGGTEYKLPFVDKVVYRTIKDGGDRITALRTAKLDILGRSAGRTSIR